jgi:hypothetical protein
MLGLGLQNILRFKPASHVLTTVYTVSLTSNDGGNQGNTLRSVIAASNLSAAIGTTMRATVKFFSAPPNGVTLKMYVGRAAGSGHSYDFSGNQVEFLWGGSATLAGDGVTTTFASDFVTLGEAFSNSFNYVFAYYGVGGNVNIAYAAHTGDNSFFQAGDHAADTAPTMSVSLTNTNEFITKIEIQ